MGAEPNVFLIGHDRATLETLGLLLNHQEFELRKFATAEEFLHTSYFEDSGCVVTSLHPIGIDGGQLQQTLLARKSPLSVVVITAHIDISYTVRLMRRGAVAVLERGQLAPDDLVAAVKRGLWRSIRLHRQFHQIVDVEQRLSRLTDDERQVMRGMIAGKPNKRLARELRSSARTIDRRRSSVLTTMGVRSIGELATVIAQQSVRLEMMNELTRTHDVTD